MSKKNPSVFEKLKKKYILLRGVSPYNKGMLTAEFNRWYAEESQSLEERRSYNLSSEKSPNLKHNREKLISNKQIGIKFEKELQSLKPFNKYNIMGALKRIKFLHKYSDLASIEKSVCDICGREFANEAGVIVHKSKMH